MKKALLILAFILCASFCYAEEETCLQPADEEQQKEEMVASGRIWCCCPVANGQMCCGWVYMCPGLIPGCFCQ